jgi:MFS family permease
MAITGGALADIWGTPLSRGIALDIFVATAFIGPVLGPIIGSFITQSYLGWRWCLWLTMILGYSASVAGVLFLPETFGPRILTQRAKELRFETKDWALHSKAEEEQTNLTSIVRVYLLRPWRKLPFF